MHAIHTLSTFLASGKSTASLNQLAVHEDVLANLLNGIIMVIQSPGRTLAPEFKNFN
jgi:hypothetical protein